MWCCFKMNFHVILSFLPKYLFTDIQLGLLAGKLEKLVVPLQSLETPHLMGLHEKTFKCHSFKLFSISMTKRYLTSDFIRRSMAELVYVMGIFSIIHVMLCAPQKSSISCVSAIPPIKLPPTKWRPTFHHTTCHLNLHKEMALRKRVKGSTRITIWAQTIVHSFAILIYRTPLLML